MVGSHAPRPKRYKDTLHDEAWLRARYEIDLLSLAQIGALIGAPKPTVGWALRKWGIPRRGNAEGKRVRFDRRGRRRVTKAEFVAAYGGACACCGERELAFLSLDHPNGGGAAHRRSFGKGDTTQRIMREARAAGWPATYRVLCMNCQFGTRYGRTCPHQMEGT